MFGAYICILTSLTAAPALFVCFYFQDSFSLSVSMLGINYLFAEAWGSPSITMLMECSSPENVGLAISAYLFMSTISGMISTVLLGYVQHYQNAESNLSVYGSSLNIFMMISYLGCIPAFYIAGRSYKSQHDESLKKFIK